MSHMRYCSILSVLALVASVPATVAAHPSHEDPDAPLAVRPGDEAANLVRTAMKLYTDTQSTVNTMLKRLDDGRLRQLKQVAIGETYLDTKRLERLGQKLSFLAEPAGVDFVLRATSLRNQLETVIAAYKQLPGMEDVLKRAEPSLRREASGKATVILKAERLGAAGKWEQAEEELLQALDSMEPRTVWFSPAIRQQMLGRYDRPLQAVSQKSWETQKARTEQTLAQLRNQEKPDLTGLVAELRQATAAIRATGQANVGGRALNGPALVEEFGRRWRTVQLATIRCRALDWARGATAASDLQELTVAHTQFSKDIVIALAEVIEADAGRISAGDARSLYTAYLAALAPLVGLEGDGALEKAARPALEKLLAKSPEVAAEVAAYRAATAELLRWRQRTAQSLARAAGPNFPPVEKELLGAVAATPPKPGLVPTRAADTSQAALLKSPAPAVMRSVVSTLMGRRVGLINMVGLPIAKKMATSRYHKRTYGLLALPPPYEAEVAMLESDLMVTASAPPLTLEAAAALASARRGDLVAAGGEITGMYLESVINRFATLKAAGLVLLPLGPLAPEPNGNLLSHVVMRFDVEPVWLENEYFFVKVK